MIGAHRFPVLDVVLPMRTPSRWPAVRTERSHSFVPTECDGAYYHTTMRLPGARSAGYPKLYASQRFFDFSLFSSYSHLHWHVPSTEFCPRRQAAMFFNVTVNIIGKRAARRHNGDKIDARVFLFCSSWKIGPSTFHLYTVH